MLLEDENLLENVYGVESEEGNELIVEALIEDVGLENFSEEEVISLVECGLLSERSVVRLDKKAHKSRATKKTAIIMAKEHNDPLYKRLRITYIKKKKLIQAIMLKYGNRAKTRVNKIKFTNKGMVKPKTASVTAIKKIAKTVEKNSSQIKAKDINK